MGTKLTLLKSSGNLGLKQKLIEQERRVIIMFCSLYVISMGPKGFHKIFRFECPNRENGLRKCAQILKRTMRLRQPAISFLYVLAYIQPGSKGGTLYIKNQYQLRNAVRSRKKILKTPK